MLSLSRIREMLQRFGRVGSCPAHEPINATPNTVRRLTGGTRSDAAAVDDRYARAELAPAVHDSLLEEWTQAHLQLHAGAIENFIGTIKVPVGIAGPVRVNGQAFVGDCFVPLATTEAALVASVDRGLRAITDAGGAVVLVVSHGVQRAPAFVFETVTQAANFIAFAASCEDQLRAAAATTSRFGRVNDIQAVLEGNCAWLVFTLDPADAAGQNMVTFATRAAIKCLLELSPIKPLRVYEEGNLSGDKKANHLAFLANRGRKACAEVLLPAELVERRFHATAEEMVAAWTVLAMGGIHSGSIGIQGHYANTLAALFLATGQDIACVAEASVGITRFELRPGDGGQADLYASVSLPGLVVGTVGGGTELPSQRAALSIMGLDGPGAAPGFAAMALAEITAVTCLGGELSIIGALAAGDFAEAHHRLARQRQPR